MPGDRRTLQPQDLAAGFPEQSRHHCLLAERLVLHGCHGSAGCGSYGDGRQWQEDSGGFSYLVVPRSPPSLNSAYQLPHCHLVMATAEVHRLPQMSLLVPGRTGLHWRIFTSRRGVTAGNLGAGVQCLQLDPDLQAESVGSLSKKPSLRGFYFSSSTILVCCEQMWNVRARG